MRYICSLTTFLWLMLTMTKSLIEHKTTLMNERTNKEKKLTRKAQLSFVYYAISLHSLPAAWTRERERWYMCCFVFRCVNLPNRDCQLFSVFAGIFKLCVPRSSRSHSYEPWEKFFRTNWFSYPLQHFCVSFGLVPFTMNFGPFVTLSQLSLPQQGLFFLPPLSRRNEP